MIDTLQLFKCLADETRLKSLILLQFEGELCVCELMEALQEIQPKISRHLALLREHRLVLDRRQGQWIYYRLNPDLPDWVKAVLAETTQSNKPYIDANLKKLRCMGDRPERTKTCC
jgi:ArsR family transcriptional regulator, arsenate/arsenite/antimonite-responsive transcriptional repressor